MGDDDVHIERGQFAGECGQARVIAIGIAKFETQVLPLDIAEVAKPLLKFAADPLRPLPSVGCAEIADRNDPFRRLRGRRERPYRRPADEADEFASSHSITWRSMRSSPRRLSHRKNRSSMMRSNRVDHNAAFDGVVSCSQTRASRIPGHYKACRFAPLGSQAHVGAS